MSILEGPPNSSTRVYSELDIIVAGLTLILTLFGKLQTCLTWSTGSPLQLGTWSTQGGEMGLLD